MTSVLNVVGARHGFYEVTATAGTNDEGFDATAKAIVTGLPVCIQCKRYKNNLGLASVGTEIAKVAMVSALAGTAVEQHRFITSGDVAKSLTASLLRDPNRAELVKSAIDRAKTLPELEGKRTALLAAGKSVEAVIAEYVRSTKIVVWSGADLDRECTLSWSLLTGVVERFFAVQPVLLERPRPDFDEPRYLGSLVDGSERWIGLSALRGSAPAKLGASSHADPLAKPRPNEPGQDTETDAALVHLALSETRIGRATVVVGNGGAGKTTALRMTAARAASHRLAEATESLPIMLPLQRYRGSLDALVHEVLGIKHGHWGSLPGEFILLCDGLNEVPVELLYKLVGDLENGSEADRCARVVSVRSTGLRQAVFIQGIDRILNLQALTFGQARALTEKALGPTEAGAFLGALYLRRDRAYWALLRSPFGLSMAIQSFQNSRQVPETDRELVLGFFEGRIARNSELVGTALPGATDLPATLLRELAHEVAFELRVTKRRAAIPLEDAQRAVAQAVGALQARRTFGADALTTVLAWEWLRLNDVLIPSADGAWVSFQHELVADALAAPLLASRWRDHLSGLKSTSAMDDAWRFSAFHVAPAERREFLDAVADVDLHLASTCARAMGADSVQQIFERAKLEAEKGSTFAIAFASAAISTIATDAAEKWLLAAAAGLRFDEAQGNELASSALRGLCRIGHRKTLESLLEEAERFATMPGASGGEISFWESAAPDARLELARERLRSSPQKPIRLSLRAVRALGDASDVGQLAKIIENHPDNQMAVEAFRALQDIDQARALQALKNRPPDPENGLDNVHIMSVLAHAGGVDDALPLLTLLLEGASGDDASVYHWQEALLDAIDALPLSVETQAVLRRAYDEQPESRPLLWRIATSHRVEAFDALALDVARRNETHEFPWSMPFAAARTSSTELRRELSDTVDAWLQQCDIRVEPAASLNAALEYATVHGSAERAAPLVEARLAALVALNQKTGKHGKGSLSWGAELWVEMEIRHLLGPASRVADLLKESTRLDLLSVDMSTAGDGDRRLLREVVRGLDSALVDSRVTQLDGWVQVSALSVIAPLGPTDARRALMLKHLPHALRHPALSASLLPVLNLYWNADVLQATVALVAELPADPETEMFAREIVHSAIERTSPEAAHQVVAPFVGRASTEIGRKLLTLWRDAAAQARPALG